MVLLRKKSNPFGTPSSFQNTEMGPGNVNPSNSRPFGSPPTSNLGSTFGAAMQQKQSESSYGRLLAAAPQSFGRQMPALAPAGGMRSKISSTAGSIPRAALGDGSAPPYVDQRDPLPSGMIWSRRRVITGGATPVFEDTGEQATQTDINAYNA